MPAPTLVTGAAGFAGGHLLDLLRDETEHEVVAWRRPHPADETAPVVSGFSRTSTADATGTPASAAKTTEHVRIVRTFIA